MLIKNGFLINPKTRTEEKCDIRIEDGLVKEIGNLSITDGEDVIDAEGLIVAPGLIDTHIHFRDPGFTHKEDLHTGSLSAARGGFTSGRYQYLSGRYSYSWSKRPGNDRL